LQAKSKALSIRKEVEQKRFRRMQELRKEQLQQKKKEKLDRERLE
jgi:hypothetical protein